MTSFETKLRKGLNLQEQQQSKCYCRNLLVIHLQHPSMRSFEVDLRPFKEVLNIKPCNLFMDSVYKLPAYKLRYAYLPEIFTLQIMKE